MLSLYQFFSFLEFENGNIFVSSYFWLVLFYLLNFFSQIIDRCLFFHSALLVLLDPGNFIMFMTIRAFALVFVDLLIIAGEADLILAVAWVEVFLLLLKSSLTNIANILPFSHNHWLLFLRT